MPWWAWVVGSPIVLIVLLLWLVMLSAAWRSISACFRRSNWVMKVAFGGLYLKFRSYLNHHFADDGPTVVYLPWDDISTAQKIIERTSSVDSDGNAAITIRRYLDIRLKHNNTEALRQAVAKETARKPKKKVRSSFRFHHVPVQVPEPGVIRVEWRGRGMLKALQTKIEILPTRRTGCGIEDATDESDTDSQIVKLIEQGQHMAAIRTVHSHYGMSLAEAKDFVDDLAQKQTQEPIREHADAT